MTDGYFVHLPFDERTLRHDEHIACRNATVIVDGDGNFSGWVDNNKLIPMWEEKQ